MNRRDFVSRLKLRDFGLIGGASALTMSLVKKIEFAEGTIFIGAVDDMHHSHHHRNAIDMVEILGIHPVQRIVLEEAREKDNILKKTAEAMVESLQQRQAIDMHDIMIALASTTIPPAITRTFPRIPAPPLVSYKYQHFYRSRARSHL